MKKLLILAFVVAAGLLTYNFVTRGKFTLVPFSALSTEDRTLEAFEARLHAAAKMASQAGRTAGLTGMDTTSDAEAARGEVEEIEKGLNNLRKTTTSGTAKQRIEQLLNETHDLKRQMGA